MIGKIVILVSILLSCSVGIFRAEETDPWAGPWFPHKPFSDKDDGDVSRNGVLMGVLNSDCDDAKTNLEIDFDPKNVSHQVEFMCLEYNRTAFTPNYNVEPVMIEYLIPPEYSPLHRCMNETIAYDYPIPTYGSHRTIWAQYGEYSYVPPQRWLHNIEHGAIVMLYHPCADPTQIDKLKGLIKKCLYRHVITASDKLDAKRPFALVAWGHSLEMSVIDDSVVIGFVRMNALQGPEKIYRNGKYNETLIAKANIVTTNDDELLCPNM